MGYRVDLKEAWETIKSKAIREDIVRQLREELGRNPTEKEIETSIDEVGRPNPAD